MGKGIDVHVGGQMEEEMGTGERMQSRATARDSCSVPPHCTSPAAPGETRAGLPTAGSAAGSGEGHASR